MAHAPPSGGVQLTEFVKRPGLGREGRPLKVRANFFEVLSLPQQDLHHYDVTITPDVPPALNRRIFQQFEDMYRADLANIKTVFDGRKNIFAPKPLPFGDARTFELTLPEDDGITSSKRPPRNFVIKMKKAGAIRMEVLHRFLDNKQGLTNDCLTGKGELSPMVVSIPYYIFIVI
jgi:hypothetical protein